jgi:chromosome segregation ATPase
MLTEALKATRELAQSQLELQQLRMSATGQETALARQLEEATSELQRYKASIEIQRERMEDVVADLQQQVYEHQNIANSRTVAFDQSIKNNVRLASIESCISRVSASLQNDCILLDSLFELVNPHNPAKSSIESEIQDPTFDTARLGLTRNDVHVSGSPFAYNLALAAQIETAGPETVRVIKARAINVSSLGRGKGTGMRRDCLNTAISAEQLECVLGSELGTNWQRSQDADQLDSSLHLWQALFERLCILEVDGKAELALELASTEETNSKIFTPANILTSAQEYEGTQELERVAQTLSTKQRHLHALMLSMQEARRAFFSVQVEELEKERASLFTQLKETGQIKSLMGEGVQELRDALEAANTRANVAEQQLREHVYAAERKGLEMSKLYEEQLAVARNQAEQTSNSIHSLSQELESVQLQLVESQKHHNLLHQQLSNAQSSLEKHKQLALQDHASVRRNWHDEKQRVIELGNRLSEADAARQVLEHDISELRKQHHDKDAVINKLSSALEESQEQKRQVVSERETAVERWKRASSELRSIEALLVKERDEQSEQFRDVQTRLELEKERFEETQNDNQELRKELDLCSKNLENSVSRERTLAQENTALRMVTTQFEQDKKEIMDLLMQLQQSRGDVDSSREQLNEELNLILAIVRTHCAHEEVVESLVELDNSGDPLLPKKLETNKPKTPECTEKKKFFSIEIQQLLGAAREANEANQAAMNAHQQRLAVAVRSANEEVDSLTHHLKEEQIKSSSLGTQLEVIKDENRSQLCRIVELEAFVGVLEATKLDLNKERDTSQQRLHQLERKQDELAEVLEQRRVAFHESQQLATQLERAMDVQAALSAAVDVQTDLVHQEQQRAQDAQQRADRLLEQLEASREELRLIRLLQSQGTNKLSHEHDIAIKTLESKHKDFVKSQDKHVDEIRHHTDRHCQEIKSLKVSAAEHEDLKRALAAAQLSLAEANAALAPLHRSILEAKTAREHSQKSREEMETKYNALQKSAGASLQLGHELEEVAMNDQITIK